MAASVARLFSCSYHLLPVFEFMADRFLLCNSQLASVINDVHKTVLESIVFASCAGIVMHKGTTCDECVTAVGGTRGGQDLVVGKGVRGGRGKDSHNLTSCHFLL